MHHPGNDVFAGTAFALNQHRDIGSGHFDQTVATERMTSERPKTTFSGGMSPSDWVNELTGLAVRVGIKVT